MTAISPRPPLRPVALVGMMGAGKTSVGRVLAGRLGWRFADSDEEVERAAGRAIAELFEREGEARFREREREVIADLLCGEKLVLATGGGAMAEPETRALLLERAVTVWLRAGPHVLACRLDGQDDRPLLRGLDRLAIVRRLSAEREAAYRMADIHIAAEDPTADDVAAAILATLSSSRACGRMAGQ